MKDFSGVISFWGIGVATLSLTLIFLTPLFSTNVNALSSTKPRVGGACAYKQYKGEAQIVSVKPHPDEPETYEIRFSFSTQETIMEEFAKTEGKQWSIVQDDFSLPQKRFLTQYNIKTGMRLPCIMKVITQGTCPPVLFDFPTIDKGRGVQ